jgi:predicted nucleic acid-binding protein
MSIVYFDSSAFVKLVVEEDGSDLAAALWDGCDAAVSSRLAYPEVCATLAAAGRDKRLDPTDQQRAEAAWEAYWAATRAVELTEAVTADAGRLAGLHALRGADAVHLASVLAVGATDTVFAVWDRRLRAGASAAGVHLAPTLVS